MNYELEKDLRTLRHCCLSVQLNTIFNSMVNTLRRLGTAIEKEYPVEPEVTLQKFIEWLIWEVPNATITMNLPHIDPSLVVSLSSIMRRYHVPSGKPRLPLIKRIIFNVPTGLHSSIPLDAFLSEYKDRAEIHYRRKPITQSLIHFHDAQDHRRQLPIDIILQGDLPQIIEPKIHKIAIKVKVKVK